MSTRDHVASDRGHPATASPRGAARLTVVSEDPPGASAAARGPLLAVCGLCGGAGASTLAYLVALAAVRAHPAAVLLGDTGGPGGGISCYTGVQAPRSLPEAAEQVAAGLPAGQLVATTPGGVRVLATGPRFTPRCAREGIELLLDHARERYTLTVIDCGTLAREADQIAITRASHVAWALPATASGARRANRVLETINPYLLGSELLVARHDGRERKATLRELKRLAEHRHAPLVLLPTLPDLTAGRNTTAALKTAQISVQAMAARAMTNSSHSTTSPPLPTESAVEMPDSPRSAGRTKTVLLAARVAIAALAGVLVVAGVVRVALAHQARGWLGYPFRGLPAHLGVAAGIFAHNGTAILGVVGLLLIAQLATHAPGGPGRAQRLILAGGELLLAGAVASNILLVGASLGAYGERMVRAMLPHGPVELAAYALALALYVQGRRQNLPAAHVIKVAAASVALLALAAALETMVNL